jgi:hypothetical protein
VGVVFLGGHVSGVPDLIDEDIGDVAAVVSFMEREPVWDVGGCLHLDHGEDRRVVVTTERRMFDTQQPRKARGGDGEALPVPELERKLLEYETNNIAIGKGEGIITTIMWADSDERLRAVHLPDAQWARAHRRLLVVAPEKDREAVPGRACGEANRRVAELLMENPAKPRHRVVTWWFHRHKAGERAGITHGRAVHIHTRRAPMDDRLHDSGATGAEASEKLAGVAAMTRGPAEPAHYWITIVRGSVEVAEAAKATTVQV